MPESSDHYSEVILPDTVQRALRDVFTAVPAVEAVYLFGSHASGRAHHQSDVDLGVVVKADASMPDKLDLLAALVERGIDNVDLVFLDRADPVVRYEAVRPNVLVCRTVAFDHGTYYSQVVRRYLDLQPLLARQRRAYKRHLLQGA